ncbi:MAG TPA: hypothetical protein VFT19_05235 [Solirubrobacterales bacterium]|nr:hypothetical protein [Solirubrobacterales bacterium]
MAEEYEKDGQRVIKAKITHWKLKERERALFADAERVTNWKLADKSRRLLADLSSHLSDDLPEFVGRSLEDLGRPTLRKAALIATAGITVRAAGSGMALVSCGYLAESAGPARRGLEAKLNAMAILDDESGEYAINYLRGRSRGLTKLAEKYGTREDVVVLSRIAHADVRGLSLLHLRSPRREGAVIEGIVDLSPSRDDVLAGFALYALAYEAAGMCAVLAEGFNFAFEVPPWVSGELQRQGDRFRQALTE